jgi:hypothetical protein
MSETQLRELFSRHSDAAEPPLSPQFLAQSVDAGRRRMRRGRAARAATGGVAAVAALTIAATAIFGGSASTGRPGQQVVAEPQDAVTLLGRISLAAGQRSIEVRDDQFIYEKRWFVSRVPVQGKDSGEVTEREVSGSSERWVSVDGTKPGWHTLPDKQGQPFSQAWPVNSQPSLAEPTYKYLTTLPTDPDALLEQVRAAVAARPGKPGDVTDPDQEAFDLIGLTLNQTMLPPLLGAALYQATARIPGVTVIADATDAAGRPGIAVSRTSSVHDSSAMWIFKKGTYEFLGAHTVNGYQPKLRGDTNYAIIMRAVVDQVRQTPR